MAVLHFVNTTPIDWVLKRQATITYCSEFVATKTPNRANHAQKNTKISICPHHDQGMFGDNKSVFTSSTIAQSILIKRHNMFSYHRVREAIAAKILELHCCLSDQNIGDILSKHWEHAKVKDTMRELFDYQGDITLVRPD